MPAPDLHDHDAASNATKLTLMGVFFSVMALFSTRLQRERAPMELRPFDLLLLGLSSFRIGRMVAFEGVARPLREPFTETKPDDSGAGETTVASGVGARHAVGELLSCPICTGTWVAAGLVYGLHWLPRPTRVLLAIMSTTGVAHLLYSLTEALSWVGHAARKQAA